MSPAAMPDDLHIDATRLFDCGFRPGDYDGMTMLDLIGWLHLAGGHLIMRRGRKRVFTTKGVRWDTWPDDTSRQGLGAPWKEVAP